MSKPATNQYPPVTVHWIDITSTAGWRHPDDLPSVAACETRGYIVAQTPDVIYVAGTVQASDDDDDDRTVSDVSAIPMGCVVSVVVGKDRRAKSCQRKSKQSA